MRLLSCVLFCALTPCLAFAGQQTDVTLAHFEADVTPPLGAPLSGGARAPAKGIDSRLSARGIVLRAGGKAPIVLCAIDWIGIGNGGHDAWREALAEAAQTTPERVAVHALHQHDAPACDFTSEALLADQGLGGMMFDVAFARQAIARTAEALQAALTQPEPVTHIGVGKGEVKQVASNRRILGPDGTVRAMRWTSCRDPELRAEPEGTIDPMARVVSFWNGGDALALLSYYATHPQSHYGNGYISADFPGLAREAREHALRDAAHIHFTGAGGNIGAGKYNDGSPENRFLLAGRLAKGIAKAFENTEKFPITAADVQWRHRPTVLPLREEVDTELQRALLNNPEAPAKDRVRAAREIAFRERMAAGHGIPLTNLRLGRANIVHMPGELFVEYQRAAQEMAPAGFVAMAAYGDYGPGYIGTAKAYERGGYETSLYTSRVSPKVEPLLMDALKDLLR